MTRQLITFDLGGQVLGADIMAIREIRAWSPTTPLPNVPDHVRGVVNLRGVVLPVIDLRCRLGWGTTEPSARHVIIVLSVADQMRGLIVDAVDDIVALRAEDMQPLPDVGGNATVAALLEGIATIDGRMVMVLKLDRLAEGAIPMDEAA